MGCEDEPELFDCIEGFCCPRYVEMFRNLINTIPAVLMSVSNRWTSVKNHQTMKLPSLCDAFSTTQPLELANVLNSKVIKVMQTILKQNR